MRLLSGNLFSMLLFHHQTQRKINFQLFSLESSQSDIIQTHNAYNDPLMCLNKWCSAIHLDIQAMNKNKIMKNRKDKLAVTEEASWGVCINDGWRYN
jgi:hypothetical protein